MCQLYLNKAGKNGRDIHLSGKCKGQFGMSFTQGLRDPLDQVYFRDKKTGQGFPGGAVVENLPANAGDAGSSPGLGRSHMPRSN